VPYANADEANHAPNENISGTLHQGDQDGCGDAHLWAGCR
jgi:hypothetical protein